MRPFCRLYGELDRGEGQGARVEALASYLRGSEPADAAWALHLLLGKQRRRLITARALRQHALRVTGLPAWLLEASHAQVGDTAETIALLLGSQRAEPDDSADAAATIRADGSLAPGDGRDQAPTPSRACERPLHWWMERELPRIAALDEAEQTLALALHWSHLQPDQILVLNKLLTGAFRVGVGPGLAVKALARCSGLEESLLQHRLMGPFQPSAATYAELLRPPEDGQVPASRPYPFLLACPLPADGLPGQAPGDWLAEWKWDGIRGQLIHRRGEAFLWSRGEELLNGGFPDLLSLASALPEGTVLDGEVLIWPPSEERPRPFATLQRRLGQKRPSSRLLREIPASYVVYDLLESEGEDRRGWPLAERRRRLASLLAGRMPDGLRLSQALPLTDWDDLERWRQSARDTGAEGLMLKSLTAPYGSGRRRGLWWKHKLEPLHLDAVLLYARNGSGRRANLYTDYTFALWSDEEPEGDTPPPAVAGRRLVSFASAYSGLNDAELVELDRWIRRHTTERFGPVRAVEPELVFELAFEGVQRSGRHRSGVAVRFPRISRWRRDKTAAEADTLASALALIPP